jgi:protein-L-isoaspartate(D-aspartate) O-methyltransferase
MVCMSVGLDGREVFSEMNARQNKKHSAFLVALAAGLLLIGAQCKASPPSDEETLARRRQALLEELRRDISDERVLKALSAVPRHRFIPKRLQDEAYGNYPLPIGQGQTISQPFIVAYMTQALKLTGREKVLEIGTGSGYQAAVLAALGAEVYSIEILPELSQKAGLVLSDLGYSRVKLKIGDGFEGWAEHAPYDGILVTAAPLEVPAPLVAQLKENGRMVIPIGPEGNQVLYTYQKQNGKLVVIDRLAVRFVPMTGKALR